MNLTAIAIVAIVCVAIVKLTNTVFHKRNVNARQTESSGKDNSEMLQAIKNLQERVATLEKIVTDEKYDLKKEIESLR
ncbi:hypothetical protein KIH87_03555 [Paraneptunicella aestuarii]|uniref:hypothetical protein n=1 Tax=Paraneptunicella aestuarii TaxID=2831148 RepID=UPI001E294833|nr:hypothetical protein [Paraneptunicella aestuarii]UAA39445.1 hypothetical protein KIH87_03555 [Paraneptunicella aestuarii]